MSEDVFQIITSADIKALKMQLALQCSPLLAGLKVSNLLIVSSKDENHVRRLFRRSGITARVIYKGDGKTTFLLYRPDALEGYLKLEGVRKLLLWLGYKRTCLEEILDIFCCRYNQYRSHKMDFPHEMGVFLGYPLADVKGFIRHKGQNYLYAGYWKVYENEAEARSLFQIYASVKAFTVHELEQGKMFWQIVVMFPKLYEKECIK